MVKIFSRSEENVSADGDATQEKDIGSIQKDEGYGTRPRRGITGRSVSEGS